MSQTFTDDCFAAGHVAQTDLQNMENNFAALKSNFSGTAAPSNPVEGMWWADSDDNILKIYTGSAWQNVFNWATMEFYAGAGFITAAQISDAARKASLVSGESISPTTVTATTINTTNFNYSGSAIPILADFAAGSYIIATAQKIVNSTANDKRIEFKVSRAGTIRTKIQLGTTLPSDTAYMRIYKNGSPVGTIRSEQSPEIWYENINVAAGDLIQLYAYSSPVAYSFTVTFELHVNNPAEVARTENY